MTDAEIAIIGRLADMCRTKGIRMLDIPNSVHLELESQAAALASQAGPAADPDLCRCGHPEHAHMNGLCIHACDVGRCSQPEGSV